MPDKGFEKINRSYWDARVSYHVDSDFYDQESFLKGKSTLNTYELGLLGNVKGKDIIHFQCHFGQDTMSLSRLGAHVTGIDLSKEAINKAHELAQSLKLDTQFKTSNVLQVNQVVSGLFDIVFTSYGTISWLPDLEPWAEQVSKRLRTGGRFVMVDFHPIVHMLDDATMTRLEHPYFNKGVIEGEESGSYADKSAPIAAKYQTWNHSLSELFSALNSAGLQIETFDEYEHSPYPCFPNMAPSSKGYQIKGLEGKIPMLYGLVATRK